MDSTKIQYPKIDFYHYTSLGNLTSIIQNRTIRLTDYRFLNDIQEVNYALDKIEKASREQNNNYTSQIVTAIDNIRNGQVVLNKTTLKDGVDYLTPKNESVNYYTLSLSQKRDELPLWKMYAKNGCCIKFNSQKTLEFFHSFRDRNFNSGVDNISYGEVLYGNNIVLNSAIDLLVSKFNQFSNQLMIYDTIMQIALTSKCETFGYEKEYRIAVPFFKELVSDSEKYEFVVSDNIIKPQIEFKNFPVNEITEEIIISPFLSGDIVKKGVEELLNANGLNNTKVFISSIEIR